ncbi:MAG: DUF1311 domain-containing protein [Paracoccaceae bacterium]|nr:MAG: DUF1311 domain-containing protein [Paracoccaceae bacterium]
MPMIRAALTVTLGCLALPAAAQQVNCADPQFQMEINFCAEQEWLAADADLNTAYRGARDAMRRIDAALPPNERGAEVNLRDAQRAWITFRDKTCAAEGWAMKGGSGEPMLIYFCMARVTAARAEDLREMATMY